VLTGGIRRALTRQNLFCQEPVASSQQLLVLRY